MSAQPLRDPVAAAPALTGPGVTAPSLTAASRRFLSDIVVELGFVSADVAEQAVEAGRRPGTTPEKVLLDTGALTEDQLARALAERYGLEHIDLAEFPVDRSAAGLLREAAARRYQAAPVGFTRDGTLIVAVADPADSLGLSDIAVMTKLPVRPAVASRSQLDALLDELQFMEEPAPDGPQTIGTVIVPPDEDGPEEVTQAVRITPVASIGDAGDERIEEIATLRDELAAERARTGAALDAERERHHRELGRERERHEHALAEHAARAAEELRLGRARHASELEATGAKHAAEIASERASAEQKLAVLEAERVRQSEALGELRDRLEGERARREELEAAVGELEGARAALGAQLDQARAEIEDLRAELASARAEVGDGGPEADELRAQLEGSRAELADARLELELLEVADQRAEDARVALAELREESERQGELHSLIEREQKEELARARQENQRLAAELADLRDRIADATKAFEAMGSAERRLNETADALPRTRADDPRADSG